VNEIKGFIIKNKDVVIGKIKASSELEIVAKAILLLYQLSDVKKEDESIQKAFWILRRYRFEPEIEEEIQRIANHFFND
jgi:hypothetical protein